MLREILFICFLVGICSSFSITGRVVNGTDADEGEFPYAVSLRSNGRHNCGASIISNTWILTAAHCVISANAASLTIQYGVNEISPNGPNVAQVKKIIAHKKYNPGNFYINDIAVLQLESPIQFNDRVQPVKLPKQDYEVPGGTHVVLCGWGRDKTGGTAQKYLQKVDLITFSDEDCNERHHGQTHPTNICGGVPEGGKGQCNGDSGGPLTFEKTQLGIVSWSRKPCTIAPYPGVYTKVSRYIDWIAEQTGLNIYEH